VQIARIDLRGGVERRLRQRGDARRRLRVVAAAQRMESLSQRRALAGAMDLRMRGENLLGECGARARRADDEDRRGIGVGCARTGSSWNLPQIVR
jgi:hypothetical protein